MSKCKSSELFKDGLNEKLRAQMVIKGLTFVKLAELSGYSYEGTRKIVSGNGSYHGVWKVCEVLGIDMRDLVKTNLEITQSENREVQHGENNN